MREIKFRAWDGKKIHDQVSVIGGDAATVEMTGRSDRKITLDEHEGETTFYENWNTWVRKPEWILMQYTGLKDKNGVEIYEGDFLWIEAISSNGKSEDQYGYVEFDEFEYVVTTSDESWPCVSWKCVNDSEVLGNIHENPELMRQ